MCKGGYYYIRVYEEGLENLGEISIIKNNISN